ncbi:guanylate kinase [Rhodovibrionaceae bacterium A322]
MSGQEVQRRGLVLVLSSPSGAGKTTISRELLSSDKNLKLSISATTRPMRKGERDGIDYQFVSKERFQEMVDGGDMLEHATVFGNSYGTPAAPVKEALEQGQDVLFDIDWQGTQQVSAKMRDDLVRVFILPPSVEELERRLYSRAQDSEEVVRGRMAEASAEMSHYAEYDYIVVNQQLEQAIADVKAVLAAERLRRDRQVGLVTFVNKLRGISG